MAERKYIADQAEIRRFLDLLAESGQVVELRALDVSEPGWKAPHVMSGYFDDMTALAAAAASLPYAKGTYITLNPVKPDYLATACNRVRGAKTGAATSDDGILRRRWLCVDLDAVRKPSDISSTDAEHDHAIAIARRVRDELRQAGWPEPILADSGNGGHLLYRIDLPADDGGLVERVLDALALRHNSALTVVDQTLFNPSRICKLYGTWVHKGDDVPSRPHRMAKVLEWPAELATVPQELLEALAATLPAEPAQPVRTARQGAYTGEPFDIQNWIDRHVPEAEPGVAWQHKGGSGTRWILPACPWNPSHTNRSAYIVQFKSGAIEAGCQHNSCRGNDWHALRDLLEPGWRERRAAHTGGNGRGPAVGYTRPAQQPPNMHPTTAPSTPRAVTADYTGPAVWRAQDHDQPVEVTGLAGHGPDGAAYMSIAGSTTAIPQAELHLPPAAAAEPPAYLDSEDYGELPTDAPPRASLDDLLAELRQIQPEDGGKVERTVLEAKAWELTERCATLRRKEREQIAGELRKLGATGEFVRGWKAAVRDETTVSSPNGHGDTPNVVPYEADGERIYRLSVNPVTGLPMRSVVADFDVRITEEATAEDGRRWFVLNGQTDQARPVHVEIAAPDFTDDRLLLAALTQAAGAQAPVRVGMTKHLRPAIQELAKSTPPEQTRRYERTGWADGKFLIPGREAAGVTISLPRKLPYAIPATADLTLGLDALGNLIQSLDPQRTTVALSAMFLAAMARRAGWENDRFALFIAGRTGSLKTSWAQTAMCLYGPLFGSDEMLHKWGQGATPNFIMGLATKVHDLPLLVDNYKPTTGGGARDFINLVHNILEGGEKGRLNRASEMRDTKPVFTFPIFTGEDVPPDDSAALARVLVVPFEWQHGQDNPTLARAQAARQHLAAVGGAWIRWLESTASAQIVAEAAGMFEKTRADWAASLCKEQANMSNPLRVASNLAASQLTWWVLCQHPEIGEIARKHQPAHKQGLATIADDMAMRTTAALEAIRFLDVLRELIISGRRVLVPKGGTSSEPPERRIGWRDNIDASIYLMPDISRQAVEEALRPNGLGALSRTTLYAQLNSLGVIADHSEGQLTKLLRAGTDIQRVLHLKPITEWPGYEKEDDDAQPTF